MIKSEKYCSNVFIPKYCKGSKNLSEQNAENVNIFSKKLYLRRYRKCNYMNLRKNQSEVAFEKLDQYNQAE